MRNRVKKTALAAICAALAVVILIIGSLLPTGRIAFAAVAGLATAAVIIECGYLYAVLGFIAAAVLSLVLSPAKGAAVMYCLIFGWYPIVKSLIERLKSRAAEYILKLAAIAIAFAVLLMLARTGVGDLELPDKSRLIVAGAVVIGFFAYDFCFSGLIGIYMRRVRERMK